MKFFLEYPGASMQMVPDALQHSLLVEQIRKFNITLCIETGTYLGLGSTTNLARAFVEAYDGEVPKTVYLYTFEANHESHAQAVENLRKYPFVYPLLGSSMSQEAISEFIANDEPLIHPERYPDVYLDAPNNADTRLSYISESIGSGHLKPEGWNDGELLPMYLKNAKGHPLIVLDSAGGLGWLEFQVMMSYMKEKPFSLLLDDTLHVKHFRSLKVLKSDPRFEVLGDQNCWALANYTP